MRKTLIGIIIVLLLLAVLFVLHGRKKDEHISGELPPEQTYRTLPPVDPVPQAEPAMPTNANPTPSVSGDTTPLPPAVRLAVPFTSQAPFRNWDAQHEEFCEEASVLMAASYINGMTTLTPDYADTEMKNIQAFEEQRFGFSRDTTAEETAVILREYAKITAVAVVYDPTIDRLIQALAQGKVILVPAAGRQLGNPYFRQPGPLYHMLVMKGYAEDGRFIMNDPGTRRGESFFYEKSVLMNAMHDWNDGNVETGKKVVLIVG